MTTDNAAARPRFLPADKVAELARKPLVPVRHPGRVAAGLFVLLLCAMGAHGLVTNSRYEWDVVGSYLFAPSIVAGVLNTIVLTVVCMSIGIVLGIVLAVMRLSPNPVIRWVAGAYVWFFRGTPLLVQVIFWFNLAALYPQLSIGIPFGPAFQTWDTNTVISAWTAAVIALSLNEAAYMAEITRGGLQSVDRTQQEAARALGMTEASVLRRIVLPQALRTITPATGNQVIGMLKHTSLVSVISLSELLYSAQRIYAQTFETIPLLIVVSLWYLLLTTVLSAAQSRLERRIGRGFEGSTAAHPARRRPLFGNRRPAGVCSR